ncbi:MAG: hypothetical protein IJ809_02455 [Clostridia bacterium]|nr:hypothetical protein [Clostridia bacterium]
MWILLVIFIVMLVLAAFLVVYSEWKSSNIKITDESGKKMYLTEKQITQNVQYRLSSNHKMFASTMQLVEVAEDSRVSKKNAKFIFVSILQSYANLSKDTDFSLLASNEDLYALDIIYNSKEIEQEEKDNFLRAVITSICMHKYNVPMNICIEYEEACNIWANEKFDELCKIQKINLKKVIKSLESDFEQFVIIENSKERFSGDKQKLIGAIESAYPRSFIKFSVK